jgi:septal ring factor EnvC (AmiA/AmiB activator)
MIRRRRPRKGIEFSFDSFLDLVTNVVGIIIRLILVAWVGARSYQAVLPAAPDDVPAQSETLEDALPLSSKLKAHRKELNDVEERLLEQLRRLKTMQATERQLDVTTSQLSTQIHQLEETKENLTRKAIAQQENRAQMILSAAELQKRSELLSKEAPVEGDRGD